MSRKSYRLVDDGYPTFKKIVTGKKWVGRVCATQLGYYLGIIGKTTVKAPTERLAFDDVVAKHLGFGNVNELHDHNAVVRAGNRQRQAAARYVAEEMILGNFEPFGRLLDKMDKEGE